MTTLTSFRNVGIFDRLIRALLGIGFLQGAYFWLSGTAQIAAYTAGAILVLTALLGVCPLYNLLKLSTLKSRPSNYRKTIATVGAVLLLAAAVLGSLGSEFLTRRLFLEDFHAMNDAYKQTLFFTGKTERAKAVAQYERLLSAYQSFRAKYSVYQPYALKSDGQLATDLSRVGNVFANANDKVRTGDLKQAHLELEEVRSVWQNMFKRNGFSMLSVALVDFHDAMELMLNAANAKDAVKLTTLYPLVNVKLQAIESESNDADIQLIRKHLDGLLALAKDARLDELPAKGEALKSSFVKVYLARG